MPGVAQECGGSADLGQAVHAILDRDPAIEADLAQDAEDCRVIVQPGADLTVAQDGGVAQTFLLSTQVLDRVSRLQATVAGMHAHHPVLDHFQHLQRVLAGQDGVRWIVVDAEVGRVDGFHDAPAMPELTALSSMGHGHM